MARKSSAFGTVLVGGAVLLGGYWLVRSIGHHGRVTGDAAKKLIRARFQRAMLPAALAEAAIYNAEGESNLDSSAVGAESGGHYSVGLFQLNDAPNALGAPLAIPYVRGRPSSHDPRFDPVRNTDTVVRAARALPNLIRMAQTGNIPATIQVFVEEIEKPRDVASAVGTRIGFYRRDVARGVAYGM